MEEFSVEHVSDTEIYVLHRGTNVPYHFGRRENGTLAPSHGWLNPLPGRLKEHLNDARRFVIQYLNRQKRQAA